MTRRCAVTEIPRAMTGAFVKQHPRETMDALAARQRSLFWATVIEVAGYAVMVIAAGIGCATIWFFVHEGH